MSYLIAIGCWDWSYSFGVNPPKRSDDSFLESRHLHLHGKILQPRGVKVERVTLLLMADTDLNVERRRDLAPKAAGALELQSGLLRACLPVSADALSAIPQVLAAGKLRYTILDAARLHYRKALVRYFSFDESFDNDDWQEEGDGRFA